jgi:hypothetical protein
MPRRAKTLQEKAEAELSTFGLALPETEKGLGMPPTRVLQVRGKMFCILGAKDEPLDALTITLKLPVSAEMAEGLPFVRPSKGWYKQHAWVHAHFGAGDDPFAEMETLKAWIVQSYCAVAPKKLAHAAAGAASRKASV